MTIALVSTVCLPPSSAVTSTLPGRGDAAVAVKGIDLVLLEEEGDAVDVRLHRRVLVRQHAGKIELRAAP